MCRRRSWLSNRLAVVVVDTPVSSIASFMFRVVREVDAALDTREPGGNRWVAATSEEMVMSSVKRKKLNCDLTSLMAAQGWKSLRMLEMSLMALFY